MPALGQVRGKHAEATNAAIAAIAAKYPAAFQNAPERYSIPSATGATGDSALSA